MATEPIVTEVGGLVRTAPAQRVYTRSRWTGAWQLQANLWCVNAKATAAPDIPSAQLYWRYGRGLQFGSAEFQQIAKLDLLQKYVKIEIDSQLGEDPIRWYGIVESVTERRDGRVEHATSETLGGVQLFTCLGLEILLERTPIDSSRVWDAAGALTIGRALTFNGATESVDGRNACEILDSDGFTTFSHKTEFSTLWSTLTIVQYLLHFFSPRNGEGEVVIPFKLQDGSEDILAEFEEPRVKAEGKTLKALLDQLLDRRRLLSYVLEVVTSEEEGQPETVELRVFRFNDEVIESDDGQEIPANENLRTIDFDAAIDIQEATLHTDGTQVFDRVVARGMPIISCFSASQADLTVTHAWEDEQQTDYNNAASGEGDYPAENERDARARRNRDWRAHERLARVYRYVSLSYYGMDDIGDGSGGSPVRNPYLPSEEDPEQEEPFRFPGLRVLPRLPLRADYDYSGTKIETDEIVDDTPAGEATEYLLPFVAFKLDDPETLDATQRWQLGDQLAANAATPLAGNGAGRQWSVSLRPQDNAPGVVLTVHGAPAHAIAVDEFSAPDDADDEQLGALDWKEAIFTIAIAADRRLEKSYPTQRHVFEQDTIRTLVIEVPECELHYVAPGTVVGIADGVLVRTTSGGYIRDDGARLQRIARLAAEWYLVRRQAFTLQFRQLSSEFRIGDLITSIGPADASEAVRTPITEIVWTMEQGSGDQPPPAGTTRLVTGFAQLDPQRL